MRSVWEGKSAECSRVALKHRINYVDISLLVKRHTINVSFPKETYKSWHLMRLHHRVGLFGKNSEVSFGKETYDQRLFSWSGSVSQTDLTLVRWMAPLKPTSHGISCVYNTAWVFLGRIVRSLLVKRHTTNACFSKRNLRVKASYESTPPRRRWCTLILGGYD